MVTRAPALMLARYAARGLGGPLDIEAGRRWYVQAQALGLPEAADELAAFERSLAIDGGMAAGMAGPAPTRPKPRDADGRPNPPSGCSRARAALALHLLGVP